MNSIGTLRAIAATVGVEPRRLMSTCFAASEVSAAAPEGNCTHSTLVPNDFSNMPLALPMIHGRGPPNQPRRTTSGSAADAVETALPKNTKTAGKCSGK